MRSSVCGFDLPKSASLFCVLLLSLLAGCGGALPSAVSGVVTLDGAKLSSGTVTFHPVAGGAAAYGRINADGRYKIQTGARTGLAAGDYRVTVVALENVGGEGTARRITPEKYQNLSETDLQVTVARGRVSHDLQLFSAPTAKP